MNIPDGEYDLVLSDAVLAQLTGPSGGLGREGPELMCLRYTEKPDGIEDTKPKEVEISGDSFELRAASKSGEGVVMDGSVTRSQNLECIVLYNKDTKSFELKRVGVQLKASSVKSSGKRSPSDDKKPLKKRKDVSIFQPKSRARSPMEVPGKKSPAPSDDDMPLSKMSSPKRPSSTINKPSAPSPLSSAHSVVTTATSPLKHSMSASTLSSAPKMKTIVSPLQVSGKRPPSSVSTPTIVQEASSDEDEFNDLVDELEEELSDENNFITIEEPEKTRISVVSPMGDPMSFRSLVGSKDDEDDITSSEEE